MPALNTHAFTTPAIVCPCGHDLARGALVHPNMCLSAAWLAHSPAPADGHHLVWRTHAIILYSDASPARPGDDRPDCIVRSGHATCPNCGTTTKTV